METTPINISILGDQLSRFFKKIGEPGGSQLWNDFLELLDRHIPKEHPPINLEPTVAAAPNILANRFTLPFLDFSKEQLIRKVEGLGIKIDPWAKDLIESSEFEIDRNRKDCKLVEVTGADFNYTKKVVLLAPFTNAITTKVLKQCPYETALQYCLSKGANISGHRLFFGARGLGIKKRKDERPHILKLDNMKLSAIRVAQDRFFLPTDKILFEQA